MRYLLLLVVVACWSPKLVDPVNHHYIARIKGDTLVDHRNAWTLQAKCIPEVQRITYKVGDDIPLVQGGKDSCPWANPTALVHP